MRDDFEISRVLAIAAHPDDLDFGAAGTIAAWTGAGIEVVYCIVTDGDAGGFDETFPRAEMAPLRRAEQIAAAGAWACTTCASWVTRTAGSRRPSACAGTWPG